MCIKDTKDNKTAEKKSFGKIANGMNFEYPSSYPRINLPA
jgi:hypothetical protein